MRPRTTTSSSWMGRARSIPSSPRSSGLTSGLSRRSTGRRFLITPRRGLRAARPTSPRCTDCPRRELHEWIDGSCSSTGATSSWTTPPPRSARRADRSPCCCTATVVEHPPAPSSRRRPEAAGRTGHAVTGAVAVDTGLAPEILPIESNHEDPGRVLRTHTALHAGHREGVALDDVRLSQPNDGPGPHGAGPAPAWCSCSRAGRSGRGPSHPQHASTARPLHVRATVRQRVRQSAHGRVPHRPRHQARRHPSLLLGPGRRS